VNATELNRLRWRYLDAHGATMTDEDVAALDRLLDLADNDLWDLVAGRAEPTDEGLRPLVDALRAA
jgi:antitoxin CptB